VRPQGNYDRTRELLERSKQIAPQIPTKSGFMVGLGETADEVYDTMHDLRAVGVDLVTIGQYLQPSKDHVQVAQYIVAERYAEYRRMGQELGFRQTFAGPFVRSSFHAGELFHADEVPSTPGAVPDHEWIALEPR
jgi:lipoic acid synthetase